MLRLFRLLQNILVTEFTNETCWQTVVRFSWKMFACSLVSLAFIRIMLKVVQQTSVNPDSIWPTILSGLGEDPD